MLCEYCNIKNATVTLTQNINGEIKTINICQDCANALGVIPNTLEISDSIDDIDSFFASMFGSTKSNTNSTAGTIACDFCSTTLNEIQKTGKLGCAHCYDVFTQNIEGAIRHIHSANTHCGKIPFSVDGKLGLKRKIDELKAKLSLAVQNEEYEKAAKIRDEIKALTTDGGDINEQKLV